MGVNHFGHVLLTLDLMDIIEASSPSRIVVVSSEAHELTSGVAISRVADGSFVHATADPAHYSSFGAYAESKLANVYFGRWLSQKLSPDSKVFVNVAHPGFVETELVRYLDESLYNGAVAFAKLVRDSSVLLPVSCPVACAVSCCLGSVLLSASCHVVFV